MVLKSSQRRMSIQRRANGCQPVSRTLPYLCLMLLASGFAEKTSFAQSVTHSPLAYVRRLRIAPISIALALPRELEAPAKPRTSKRVGLGGTEEPAKASLHAAARDVLRNAIVARVQLLSGLNVVESDEDAVLECEIDHLTLRSGFERRVWIRVRSSLRMSSGRVEPITLFASGESSTTKGLLRKAYQGTDEELLSRAAAQAARQLVHSLVSGDEHPFARSAAALIVPAGMPDSVSISRSGKVEDLPSGLTMLARHADVLLQPEVGAAVSLVDPDAASQAAAKLNLSEELVSRAALGPPIDALCLLASSVGADYIFWSRIGEAGLTETSIIVAKVNKPGLERHAEVQASAALIRASDRKVIWRDSATGTATARTEYVRGRVKIRSEEQCLVDAARSTYAAFRFSLEDYKRKFER